MASAILILASFIVGFVTLKVASFVWYLIRAYVLTKIGFYKDLRKYGEWAVITGASDGIGKEYAKQLAGYGLNIILISRTESKLQKVAEEIKKESKVEVRVIVFDFTKVLEYGNLVTELEGLDIGVLVNNVGQTVNINKPFHEVDVEGFVRIMNVNMIADVRMSHMVLPGMMQRKRGAIVHISSIAAHVAVPGLAIYGATKIFMNKFVETLMLESKGLVDHQVVEPGYVASSLSCKEPTATIPSAKRYVASAIKTIGIAETTCGFPFHELMKVMTQFVPLWILAKMQSQEDALNEVTKKTS